MVIPKFCTRQKNGANVLCNISCPRLRLFQMCGFCRGTYYISASWTKSKLGVRARMASASSKAIFGRRRPTARSDNMVNSSAEIIDDTPENRCEYIQRNPLFNLLLSPMTVRADAGAAGKESALLKSRLATPRSPQVRTWFQSIGSLHVNPQGGLWYGRGGVGQQ